MNPLDDHELLLWSMRAGLTRAEVRQTVRRGLEAGDLSWPTANETAADRQHRLQAARDYLYDQLLAGYDTYQSKVAGWQGQGVKEELMAPWQWRNLPSHARARWLSAEHMDVQAAVPKDEYGNITDPSWVLRSQSKHAFNIGAITRSSFLGIEGGRTLSTWDPSKVMKRIQMLGAHEQVGFTGAPTTRGFIKPGPDSPMADEYSRVRAAFVIGGDPGPPGQGYIDPSVGSAVSRYVKDVWARPGETLTGLPEVGTRWAPGADVKLASQLNPTSDRSWGYELLDYAPISRQKMVGGEMQTQQGYRMVFNREADLSTARLRMKSYAGKLEVVPSDLSGITDMSGRPDQPVRHRQRAGARERFGGADGRRRPGHGGADQRDDGVLIGGKRDPETGGDGFQAADPDP